MDQISHHHRLQLAVQLWVDAQHFEPPYWLACYERETGIILRLVRVHSQHPASIQRLLPIEPRYEAALIEVAYDRTFKWVGGPYSVLDP